MAQFPSNVDRSNPLLHIKRPLAAGGTRALRASGGRLRLLLGRGVVASTRGDRMVGRGLDRAHGLPQRRLGPVVRPHTKTTHRWRASPMSSTFLEPSDCGAVQLHYKLGWAMAVLCGHHRVMVTAEDREVVEALAIERIAALGQIHGELPSCRHLLTVDPVGAVTAAKTPSR